MIKLGGPTLVHFKTYYKATVVKSVWYWHNDKHIDKWRAAEIPEISPYICDQLIFDKITKKVQRERNCV